MARFRAVPASPTARLAVAQRRLSLMPFGHQRYATRFPSINHRLPLELRRSRRRKATLVPSPHSPVAVQRWAGQRTVRCKRMLAGPGPCPGH